MRTIHRPHLSRAQFLGFLVVGALIAAVVVVSISMLGADTSDGTPLAIGSPVLASPSRTAITPTPPAIGTADAAGPTASVLPSTGVRHLVYAYVPSESVEVWIDAQAGLAIQTTTNAAGEVMSVMQRRGLTLSDYRVYAGTTSLTTRTLLSEDDPTLVLATIQLDQYRWGLEHGGVTRVEGGRTQFNGQEVIEVHAWAGADTAHVALIDVTTLCPVALFTPGGDQMQFTYSVTTVLDRDDVDPSVFAFDVGEPMYVETYELLTPESAAGFSGYPLSSLGDAFGSLTLARIERHQAYGPGVTSEREQVSYSYQQLDDAGDVVSAITVKNRPALTEDERSELAIASVNSSIESAHLASGETVRGRLTGTDGSVAIEIDRSDGYIVIHAPDRETGLRAAEALVRVNTAAFPDN